MQIKTDKQAEYAAYRETNTQDFYSKGVVDFSEKWAALMEERIAAGATVVDCAKDTAAEVDADMGISGFMYGCAVSALAAYWEHGEELRRWHNIDTQIGTEGERANESGGVLNPALLTIG
jgi:hypothetical protein